MTSLIVKLPVIQPTAGMCSHRRTSLIRPTWLANTEPKKIATATSEVTLGMKYAIR
ncbi:hypothetical protein [Actinoallomurus acanthiterrae]